MVAIVPGGKMGSVAADNQLKAEAVVDANRNLHVPDGYRTTYQFFGTWALAAIALARRQKAKAETGKHSHARHPSILKERIVKVLMVLTSHDQLGNTGRKTGFWLEELAAPYYVFKDAGAQITLASPKGGRPPLDPKSNEPSFQTDVTRRFEKDADAEAQLDRTVRLDRVRQEDYDTVFYPGGHGPMWDIAEDENSIKLIESFLAAGKHVALVCHAPGALRHVKTPKGKPLVEGKNVTGFTNGEEEEVGLTKVVPFLVEDELMSLGAIFSKVKNWGVHTIADGQLITGQNPCGSS
jgi:putative intracellular protease/amidase